jgi:hypothetical protein
MDQSDYTVHQNERAEKNYQRRYREVRPKNSGQTK